MIDWRKAHGDRTVADVAHFLSTPYPTVRRTPIGILLRMHVEAARLSKRRR